MPGNKHILDSLSEESIEAILQKTNQPCLVQEDISGTENIVCSCRPILIIHN